MNKLFRLTLLILLVLLHPNFYAQTHKIDSLKSVLQKQQDDTSKAMTLVFLSWELSNLNLQSADSVCQICIRLSKKLNFSRGLAGGYNTLGKVRILQNNPQKSIEAYLLAEKEYVKQGQRKGLATIYSNLGNVYGDIGQPEKALNFYYKSLAARKEINDERGLGDCYNNLGVIYKNRAKYDSSIYYHNLALKIRTKVNYQGGIAYSLINLSGIYTDLGDYKTGTEYLIKGLKIVEKENDYRGIFLCLSNIAENNIRIKDYKNALLYNQKAMEIAIAGGFKFNLANIYRIFGTIYFQTNDIKSAKSYCRKGYAIAKEINDINQMSQILSQLSTYYKSENNYYASDTCLQRAIMFSRKNNLESELASMLINYASNLIEKNNFDLAFKNLKEAESIYSGTNVISGKYELYGAYVEYYKKMKKPEIALEYYEKYNTLKDTIYNTTVSNKIEQLLSFYETEKKDKQISLLQQQAKVKNLEIKEKTLLIQRRNLTLAVITITILLLIIAVILFTRFEKLKNNQRKFELIKETEILERRRIAKDIHDELGSGLTKIKFLSEISQQQNKDSSLTKNLKTISETVYSLVDNMRDLIWALNPNNTTLDNLLARIREYCSEYIEEINIEFHFNFPEHIPEVKINNQAHRNIFLTIKEALQNSIKHSHASIVKLNIEINNETLLASFSDNGKGFDTNKHKNLESNGMLNMKHRIETIGGDYNISSDIDGTVISFKIELSEIGNQNNTLV